MRRRRLIGCAAGAAAWLAGCGQAPAPVAVPRWPALPVRDLAGVSLTLASTGPRARLINVWALWCPPCRQELPSLARLASALAPRGVEVCAVALAQDLFPVREYLAQNAAGLHGLVLSPGVPAARPLGLDVLPQTFLVASDATVLARWTGAREWDLPTAREQIHRLLAAA